MMFKKTIPAIAIFFILSHLAYSASLLPPPFSLISDPSLGSASCASCGANGKNGETPYLNSRGVAHLNVEIAELTLIKNNLLTITLGENVQFSPTEAYQLLPPGAPGGNPEFLIVSLLDKKIGFRAKMSELGETSFTSVNYPGYSIHRDKECLVLDDLKISMKYLFSSMDGGISWKLSEIRNSAFPAMNLKCEYDEKGYMSKIILPDNSACLIEHKGGLPHKVTVPGGVTTEILWDDKSHVKRITTSLPPGHPFHPGKKIAGKPFISRDIHAECDPRGRLVSLVTTSGDKFAVEYRFNKEEKENKEFFCGIITNPDKSKAYCSVTHFNKDGSEKIEMGFLSIDKNGKEFFDPAREQMRGKKANTLVVLSEKENGREYKYLREGETTAITGKTNPLGLTTKYLYNTAGLKTTTIYPDGSYVSTGYDSGNRIISKTDECGRKTLYSYNKNGTLASVDESGIVTRYEYDEQNRPVKTISPGGVVHIFSWDKLFRMTSHVKPDGTTVSYSYPLYLKFPTKIEIKGISVSQEQGTDFVAPSGDRGGISAVASAKENSSSHTETFVKIFSYEPFGRVSKITYPDKTTEKFFYGCCSLVKTIDRTGAATEFTYDPAYRRIAQVSPNGDRTQWKYDSKNNVVEVIHPNKTSTKYEYDSFGDKVKEINPNGSAISYKYDVAGNRIESIYSDGTQSTFNYDVRGRLVKISGTHENNIVREYDKSGGLIAETDHSLPFDSKGRKTSYKLDTVGRVVSITNPNGRITNFSYDEMTGMLTTTVAQGMVNIYNRDNAGKITAVARYSAEELKQCKTNEDRVTLFKNNIVEKRRYDSFSNLLEVRKKRYKVSPDPATMPNTSSGEIAFLYDYSPDGQLNSILISMPESGAVKQTYVYSYRGGGVREVSVYKKEIKSSELAKLDCPEQYGTYQIAAKGNFIPSDKRDNGQLIERYSMDGSFRLNSEDALGSKTEYKHNDIRSVLSNFKRRNAVESQIRQ